MKPRILVLFCCAGGSSQGYADAGFEVVGVDIAKQPRYPFEFYQMNALSVTIDGSFDAIHAAPPCQLHSQGTVSIDRSKYPDLIGPTRELLKKSGLPYIIENVKRAPLLDPITLCGASFGLTSKDDEGPLVLRRHRIFESNIPLTAPACECRQYQRDGYKIAGCYGGARRTRYEAEQIRHGGYVPAKPILQELMGIDWMTEWEMFQATPPAFTEYLGKQLREVLAS
jgi:DNA (cytosine-5)-methyltransferase 1